MCILLSRVCKWCIVLAPHLCYCIQCDVLIHGTGDRFHLLTSVIDMDVYKCVPISDTVAAYTKICTQLTKAYVCGRNVLQSAVIDWICYVYAQDQFASYQQRSSELLRYHWPVFISFAITSPRPSLKWLLNDEASSCDEGLVQQLLSTVSTVEEVLRRYQPEEVCLAFNGGKDCTVLLDLFAAVWSRYGGSVYCNWSNLLLRTRLAPSLSLGPSFLYYNLQQLRVRS